MTVTLARDGRCTDPAVETFAAFAPHYESFSRAYRHDRWLRTLAELARQHGLCGRDVLDVACGTGKSLAPLIDAGYRVIGCDISAEMLDVARQLHPGVELHQADMRDLPMLGRFAWVTCMNDALNYMLADDDLARTFKSMRRLLIPRGLIAFDVTSGPQAQRRAFTCDRVWIEEHDSFICWHGLGCEDSSSLIGRGKAVIFTRSGNLWDRVDTHHRQRLWSDEEIRTAAQVAGLDVVGRYGQRPGCIVERECDERHPKTVYFLRRPADLPARPTGRRPANPSYVGDGLTRLARRTRGGETA